MDLTTIELAKKLIEKADKIQPNLNSAFSQNDGGYYIKCYLGDNKFCIVVHEDYIYVSKEGYKFTISIERGINIEYTKLEIKGVVFNNFQKVTITDFNHDCEFKEEIIKNDIKYILDYKK